MSKRIVPALGGNALDDDLVGQMKTVRTTSQATVDLIAQGHEVIITHSNGPQVGMINQAFEAAAKTETHSPMLSMSVYVALSQDYIGYDLQNALRGELFSWDVNKPVATLVTQVEVDAGDPVFPNPTKPTGSLFIEQGAEQLTKQGHTLKEDTGCGYRRVVASLKPVDIIEEETARALVDADQVVITVGGDDVPVTHEGSHLRSVSAVIDKNWASARLAEVIDADMLIILTAVEKAAINFGKENEQWPDRLLLSDVECFIEEGHFAKGSMLPKVEAVASSARSHAGREVLITVLSKAKEGIEGRTGTVICQ